jgi:hypothetical protein
MVSGVIRGGSRATALAAALETRSAPPSTVTSYVMAETTAPEERSATNAPAASSAVRSPPRRVTERTPVSLMIGPRRTAPANAARSQGLAAASRSLVAATPRRPRRTSASQAIVVRSASLAPRASTESPSSAEPPAEGHGSSGACAPGRRSYRIRAVAPGERRRASATKPPRVYAPPRRSSECRAPRSVHGRWTPPPAKKPSCPRYATSGGNSPTFSSDLIQNHGRYMTGTP